MKKRIMICIAACLMMNAAGAIERKGSIDAESSSSKLQENAANVECSRIKLQENADNAECSRIKLQENADNAECSRAKWEECEGNAENISAKFESSEGNAKDIRAKLEESEGKAKDIMAKCESSEGKAKDIRANDGKSIPSANKRRANDEESIPNAERQRIESSEFLPEGVPGEGWITAMLNKGLEKAMRNGKEADEKQDAEGKKGKASDENQIASPMKYGRNISDYISAPKFGGYFIGKYSWTDKTGAHGGDGFSQRMIRLYVDGTILKDFKYRLQAQVNNSAFHMKDYFIEWCHWKEFSIKLGQYKRAFLFENLCNPWEIGLGDNAQVVRKLAGMSDYCGEPSGNGGRDQGIQLQGDLFPSKRDGHRFMHYQIQLMNGQGINAGDQNRHKDWIGTLQVQPIRDLFFGVFGWTGNYVANGVTVDRKRWAVGGRYEHNDWSARIEYAHHHGHKISEYIPSTKDFSGSGRADGWYATLGMPLNKWLKIYVKYDAYRDQADWSSLCTMYSLVPNLQIHRNLRLQLQYNYIHDRLGNDHDYHEIWAETYVRF